MLVRVRWFSSNHFSVFFFSPTLGAAHATKRERGFELKPGGWHAQAGDSSNLNEAFAMKKRALIIRWKKKGFFLFFLSFLGTGQDFGKATQFRQHERR